jgi:hypothetical protein
MASGDVDVVYDVLSNDERSKIPEDIRKKIESYIKIKTEESVVAKALLETTRGNLGKYLLGGVICVFWNNVLSNSSLLWEM